MDAEHRDAHVALMDRLKAEESLRRSLEAQVLVAGEAGGRVIRRWERQAAGPQPEPDAESVLQSLSGLGLPVVEG